MITKYRTWFGTIQKIDVEKETSSSVWIGGRRRAKEGQSERFYDTWLEAWDYLLEEANKDVMLARRRLEMANGKLGNIKGMKEPVEQ